MTRRDAALRALRAAGWHPGRSVPVHLARAALLGAGQPAWPAALDVLAEYGGLRVPLADGWLQFDVLPGSPPPDDHALVGRTSDGSPVSVDADGQIWMRDTGYADAVELIGTWDTEGTG